MADAVAVVGTAAAGADTAGGAPGSAVGRAFASAAAVGLSQARRWVLHLQPPNLQLTLGCCACGWGGASRTRPGQRGDCREWDLCECVCTCAHLYFARSV